MLTKSEEYTDQGQDYFEEHYRERVLRQLVQRAEKMGMKLVATNGLTEKIIYNQLLESHFLRSS